MLRGSQSRQKITLWTCIPFTLYQVSIYLPINRNIIEGGNSKCSICSKPISIDNENKAQARRVQHENMNANKNKTGPTAKLSLETMKQVQLQNGAYIKNIETSMNALKELELEEASEAKETYNEICDKIIKGDYNGAAKISSSIIKNKNRYFEYRTIDSSDVNPGAISYSLPCVAVMNRSYENELKRLEIESYNKSLLEIYDKPQNLIAQYKAYCEKFSNDENENEDLYK